MVHIIYNFLHGGGDTDIINFLHGGGDTDITELKYRKEWNAFLFKKSNYL